jgi:hypothetical protein
MLAWMIENGTTFVEQTVGQRAVIQVMFLYTFQLANKKLSYGLVRNVKLWI